MNDFADIFKALTYDRLKKYRENSSKGISYPDIEVIQRYLYNMEISNSLNKSIHILEVVLRNRLVDEWNKFLGTNDWPLNKKGIPSSLKYQRMISDINKAIQRSGNSHDNGKIVAELSFGFWLHLLSQKFQKTNIKIIKEVFKYKSDWNNNLVISINELHQKISKIHQLRNRIAHHEPIFIITIYENSLMSYWN